MDRPEKRFVTWRCRDGHFDLLHPDKIQTCYDIIFPQGERPQGISRFSFTVDPAAADKSLYSYPSQAGVIELVTELIALYETYLYTAQLEHAKKLLEILIDREDHDYEAELLYDIEFAKWKVYDWTKKLKHAQDTWDDYKDVPEEQ